jgi:hypothetical protein
MLSCTSDVPSKSTRPRQTAVDGVVADCLSDRSEAERIARRHNREHSDALLAVTAAKKAQPLPADDDVEDDDDSTEDELAETLG